jgi:hypothetical protein
VSHVTETVPVVVLEPVVPALFELATVVAAHVAAEHVRLPAVFVHE